jgi:4-hydroxybenzoyl-CoA reductase subunit beta
VRQWNEIVVRVRIPLEMARYRTSFRKLRQRQSIDFPLLNLAVAVDIGADTTVKDMRMVVSALGSRPRVIAGLDKVAIGRKLDSDTIDAIGERAFQQCHPLTNIIVDTEWRRAMVPVQVRRALLEISQNYAGGATTRGAT